MCSVYRNAALHTIATHHTLIMRVNCWRCLSSVCHLMSFSSLAAFWLTAILNVLRESPCSLAAQQPSVEASVPGSVCQSTAPIQPNLLPQLSAFLPQQTPHCRTDLHAIPVHLPCVNEEGGRSLLTTGLSRKTVFTHSSPSVLCCVLLYVFAGFVCVDLCGDSHF